MFRSLHLWQRVYSSWLVYESGLVPRLPLSYADRMLYLSYRSVLQGNNLIVYDIGASVGLISGGLAKLPNIDKIYAFEPIPDCCKQLVKNVASYPQVICHNVALGDRNDKIQMNVEAEQWIGASSLLGMTELHKVEFPGSGQTRPILVDVVRLDDYAHDKQLLPPDLVKIDVQGYEDRVLLGGRETISQAKYCILEMSLQPLYKGCPLFDDIYLHMREMGFKLIGFADFISADPLGQPLQVDGIFENEDR